MHSITDSVSGVRPVFASIASASNRIDFQDDVDQESRLMTILVLRFARLLFSGHAAIEVENAALRIELVAFQRKLKRLVLTSFGRLFRVGLSQLWSGWRAPLLYVQAD